MRVTKPLRSLLILSMFLNVETALHGRVERPASMAPYMPIWDSPDVTLTFSFGGAGNVRCPFTHILPIVGGGSNGSRSELSDRENTGAGISSQERVGMAGRPESIGGDVSDSLVTAESSFWATLAFPCVYSADIDEIIDNVDRAKVSLMDERSVVYDKQWNREELEATAEAILGPWEEWGRD